MNNDRKSRLAQLAARAGRNPLEENINHVGEETTSQHQSDDEKRVILFRNYKPDDNSLDQSEAIEEHITKKMRCDKIEDEPSQTELEKALLDAREDKESNAAATGHKNDKDITSVTLKKVNWDLKRDISKKLQKLERRTQKAIVELLRERLDREADIESDRELD